MSDDKAIRAVDDSNERRIELSEARPVFPMQMVVGEQIAVPVHPDLPVNEAPAQSPPPEPPPPLSDNGSSND